MVTHYLNLLDRFERVIYIKEGEIMLDGSYNDIKLDSDFREFAMMKSMEESKLPKIIFEEEISIVSKSKQES